MLLVDALAWENLARRLAWQFLLRAAGVYAPQGPC